MLFASLADISLHTLTWSDGPLVWVMLSVWWYWAAVIALSFLRWRWTGDRGALSATSRPERRLMRLLALGIVLWNVVPAVALNKGDPPMGPPSIASELPLLILRWIAAASAFACLLATIYCWIEMGRDWSVAIVKDTSQQSLVTTGGFRWVRHPIYALSVLMVVLTAIACATWPMALVALWHIVFMRIKAKREEQALIGVFGDQYRDYMKTTGRFVPRLFSST